MPGNRCSEMVLAFQKKFNMAGANAVYLQLLLSIAVIIGLSTATQWSSSSKTAPSRSKQQIKASGGSSYGPVSCVPGTPQFPNYIQPMQIDPKRILGKWYRNSEWYPGVESSTFNRANLITTYSNLLNDSLTLYPGSNTPAVAFEQRNAYYDLSQSQCGNITAGALEYATVDGQYRGVGFADITAGVDTTLVLSTDYDTFIMYYTCSVYDVRSGICAVPSVAIDTRQSANLVSSDTTSAINGAVNRVLVPYCVNPDMLRKAAVVAGVGDCPLLPMPTTDCYKSLRDAYLYLGDPNFAN